MLDYLLVYFLGLFTPYLIRNRKKVVKFLKDFLTFLHLREEDHA